MNEPTLVCGTINNDTTIICYVIIVLYYNSIKSVDSNCHESLHPIM